MYDNRSERTIVECNLLLEKAPTSYKKALLKSYKKQHAKKNRPKKKRL